MRKRNEVSEICFVPEWPESPKRREPKVQWVPASSGIFATPEEQLWAFRRMSEKFRWDIRPTAFPSLINQLLPQEFAAPTTIVEALERAGEEADSPMPAWHLGYAAERPQETLVMIVQALEATFSVRTVDFSLDVTRLRIAPGVKFRSGFFWQESDLALTRGWRLSTEETEVWGWQPNKPLPEYLRWQPVMIQVDSGPEEQTELWFGLDKGSPIPAEVVLNQDQRMAGFEILWLAILSPNWIRSMDGEKVPYVFLPGLEVRPYGSDDWYGMPYLFWDKKEEHLIMGCFTMAAHPRSNSHWAVPHCCRRLYLD